MSAKSSGNFEEAGRATSGPRSNERVGSGETGSDKNIVNSVLKAFALLDCFSHERPELSPSDFVRETGLHKPTVHRLLASLERAGWVFRRENHRYRPTMRAFQLGSILVDNLDIRREASPIMAEIAARFGDTVYLTVPMDRSAVCLERAEGVQPVRIMALDVGKSLPLNIGAGPIALLAFREQELLPVLLEDGLKSFTKHSTIDERELRTRLEEVRRLGYSVSWEDVTLGVCAVGAPVFDASGTVVAAISLGGLSSRFEPPRFDEVVREILDGARRVSDRLGYTRQTRASVR